MIQYSSDSPCPSLKVIKHSSDQSMRQKQVIISQSRDKQIDLYEACCEGRIKELKLAFPKDGTYYPQINKKDKNGYCMLHYAAKYNQYDVTKFLISRGADPRIHGGQDNVTPLHFAARYKIPYNLLTHKRQFSEEIVSTTSIAKPPTSYGSKLVEFSKKTQRAFKKLSEEQYDSHGILLSQPFEVEIPKKSQLEPKAISIEEKSIINELIESGANTNARDSSGATPLHSAVMRRNVPAAKELIKLGIGCVHSKDNSWMTPLHFAAEQGCKPIAEMLIAAGANIDVKNKFYATPLLLACEEGHPELAELLVEKFIEQNSTGLYSYINHRDKNLLSALHYAAMSSDERLVSLLLAHKAECLFPTLPSPNTPLHFACAAGNLKSVKSLVEAVFHLVEEKNRDLETPLHVAASLNRIEIVEYLLQHVKNVDCVDKDFETPLYIAAKKDHVEILKMLYSHGASITVTDSKDFTALHIAAANDSLNCAKYLLSIPDVELEKAWDLNENRPIHLAVINNHIEMVKLLLNKDSPVESKNDSGLTPLLVAASHGYIEILKMLIDFSPCLALDEDDSNNTALHLASKNGFFKAIPILVDAGIGVEQRNMSQMTALDLACLHGRSKVVLSLIDEAEASINTSEGSKFKPPLLIAAKAGHPEVISILLSKGADVNKIDDDGRNCLEVAIDENREDAVQAILNSSKWEQALRHVSLLKGVYYSPLRRLIETMPDSARTVLDKCMTNNLMPKNHLEYKIFCNYEYLEDMYTAWGSSLQSMPNKNQFNNFFSLKSLYQTILHSFRKLLFRTRNRNHPLSLMLSHGRSSLLGHPLVRYLVISKWNNGPFYLYYLRMLLMILFLFFLTGLCLVSASPPYPCIKNGDSTIVLKPLSYSYADNLTNCTSCPYIPIGNTLKERFFVDLGFYCVIFLSFMSICSRLVAIFCNISNITNVQTILEMSGSILAMIYVSGFMHIGTSNLEIIQFFRCRNIFRSIGALSLCFTWLSFVLFLSKLPKLGVYVVMYMDIFRTFIQFMPIYFMLIISFALPFYMLFLDRYQTNSYVTPFKSFMKTLVATVGEIEYDTFYNTHDEPPLPVTYVILFLFLLSNSIILMNLLVGLAVDDIQGVQSNAFLKRLGLQVKMTMEFESVIPECVLKNIISLSEILSPNQKKTQNIWSWWKFKTNPFVDSSKPENINEIIYEHLRENKESIRSIKHQFKSLSERTLRMENMLEELLSRLDKEVVT